MSLEKVKMWAVRGDFGNVGNGTILGVFDTESIAKQNAVGCGSLDCGGDGHVEQVWALFDDYTEEVYVIADVDAFKLNQMRESEAKKLHKPKSPEPDFILQARVLVSQKKYVAAVKVIDEQIKDSAKAVEIVNAIANRSSFTLPESIPYVDPYVQLCKEGGVPAVAVEMLRKMIAKGKLVDAVKALDKHRPDKHNENFEKVYELRRLATGVSPIKGS